MMATSVAHCRTVARVLDGPAQFGKQTADGWSENDQPGDGQHGHERDDQAVLNEALGTLTL
jgi:hypothetical protein